MHRSSYKIVCAMHIPFCKLVQHSTERHCSYFINTGITHAGAALKVKEASRFWGKHVSADVHVPLRIGCLCETLRDEAAGWLEDAVWLKSQNRASVLRLLVVRFLVRKAGAQPVPARRGKVLSHSAVRQRC